MYKLKTKWFSKWAKKQKLVDNKLLTAIEDMQNNLSTVKVLAENELEKAIENNIFVEIGEENER